MKDFTKCSIAALDFIIYVVFSFVWKTRAFHSLTAFATNEGQKGKVV